MKKQDPGAVNRNTDRGVRVIDPVRVEPPVLGRLPPVDKGRFDALAHVEEDAALRWVLRVELASGGE